MIEPRFDLVDHNGHPADPARFRGKYLLVLFGFTHCKVVCPRALARLSEVLQGLGSAAREIQPLYISVDPERDTPAVLKTFLEGTYARFLGLTGPRDRIDEAKQAFRVFAESRPDPEDPDGYVVPHTAFAYLLDRNGAYVAHFADHLSAETVTERLRGLIQPASEVQR